MDSFKNLANLENLVGAKSAAECLFNTRHKFHKIGGKMVLVETMTTEFPTFNPNGVEARKKKGGGALVAEPEEPCDEDGASASRAAAVARNRARKRVFDFVLGDSELDLFCTLTLDRAKISRTEWVEIVPRLSTWLDNKVRRNGLKYVLVPEHHKDGAIHFHGCMNSAALRLEPSGIVDKGQEVLNIVQWKYGFTTAKRIGGEQADRVKVAKYVAKYMTKDFEMVGGRYYLHGGALVEPIYRYENTDYAKASGFELAFGGQRMRIENKV